MRPSNCTKDTFRCTFSARASLARSDRAVRFLVFCRTRIARRWSLNGTGEPRGKMKRIEKSRSFSSGANKCDWNTMNPLDPILLGRHFLQRERVCVSSDLPSRAIPMGIRVFMRDLTICASWIRESRRSRREKNNVRFRISITGNRSA